MQSSATAPAAEETLTLGTVNDQSFVLNTFLTLTLPEASGGTGSLTYSLAKSGGTGLPAGLSFDPSTRVLSGTPTAKQSAVQYTYRVDASNGDIATTTFNISVVDSQQSATPSITISNITQTTATLTIANLSSSWYYKYTTPNGGTCSSTAVTGTSVVLSSLSSNTSYTYKAYSDRSCTTELAAASALLTKPGKPTTPTVAAGTGSGQLTLSSSVSGSGAISKWQVQQKASSDTQFGSWTDISSTATTLSYTVAGLTDTTSYQFPGACGECYR